MTCLPPHSASPQGTLAENPRHRLARSRGCPSQEASLGLNPGTAVGGGGVPGPVLWRVAVSWGLWAWASEGCVGETTVRLLLSLDWPTSSGCGAASRCLGSQAAPRHALDGSTGALNEGRQTLCDHGGGAASPAVGSRTPSVTNGPLLQAGADVPDRWHSPAHPQLLPPHSAASCPPPSSKVNKDEVAGCGGEAPRGTTPPLRRPCQREEGVVWVRPGEQPPKAGTQRTCVCQAQETSQRLALS